MSDRISSYGSIVQVGHKQAEGVFEERVTIQEKYDGSQFSFMVDGAGELHCRSKGAVIYVDNPPALFKPAVESARRAHLGGHLVPGVIYRGEAFMRAKHNVLAYNRMPEGGIVLFDIEVPDSNFVSPEIVAAAATRMGVEPAVTFSPAHIVVNGVEDLRPYLEHESSLGGVQVEGVVAKNYSRFGVDHKPLMVKLVSEAFKEVHGAEWKKNNPGRRDIVDSIIARYGTNARWMKAIIHLREQGLITDSPKDIGLLMKEVQQDILRDSGDAIAAELFRHFWKEFISRGVTHHLPNWYREKLATGADDNMVIPVPGMRTLHIPMEWDEWEESVIQLSEKEGAA